MRKARPTAGLFFFRLAADGRRRSCGRYREIGGAGGPPVGGGGGAEAVTAAGSGAAAGADGLDAAGSDEPPPDATVGAGAGVTEGTGSRRTTGLSPDADSFGGSTLAASGLAGPDFASLLGLLSASGLAPTSPIASLAAPFGLSSAPVSTLGGSLAIAGSSAPGLASLLRCLES